MNWRDQAKEIKSKPWFQWDGRMQWAADNDLRSHNILCCDCKEPPGTAYPDLRDAGTFGFLFFKAEAMFGPLTIGLCNSSEGVLVSAAGTHHKTMVPVLGRGKFVFNAIADLLIKHGYCPQDEIENPPDAPNETVLAWSFHV